MGRDLAIDLGTANTLVYRQGDGIVFDEPTVVAMHGGTGEVLAMGEEAWQMIGGDSGSVVAVRPLRAGHDDRVRHHAADARGGAAQGGRRALHADPRVLVVRAIAELRGREARDRGGGAVRGRRGR